MLDWLVVGGGPHGVHIALRLVGEAGVRADAIRILDDEGELLARWQRTTRNTGMRFLRSPGVHHIGLPADGLDHFASGSGRSVETPFTRPYSRPALELFDLHCAALIKRYGLQSLHIRGRATRLEIGNGGLRVGFESLGSGGGERHEKTIEARHVVLAIGSPREPVWPEWAARAVNSWAEANEVGSNERIRHVFDPTFELLDDPNDKVIVVVGAGISGAQVALRLARWGRRVILLSRHALRVEQFDSDPGWLGPMNMGGFSRLCDPNERRERILAARHRGSMPPEVHEALRRAIEESLIDLVDEAGVTSARVFGHEVWLSVSGLELRADRVLLATGFPGCRPGKGWLDETIEALGLPCAGCGYPIVDNALRWHPRLFVMGALAELELGPVSRNLSGARRASDRILAADECQYF